MGARSSHDLAYCLVAIQIPVRKFCSASGSLALPPPLVHPLHHPPDGLQRYASGSVTATYTGDRCCCEQQTMLPSWFWRPVRQPRPRGILKIFVSSVRFTPCPPLWGMVITA